MHLCTQRSRTKPTVPTQCRPVIYSKQYNFKIKFAGAGSKSRSRDVAWEGQTVVSLRPDPTLHLQTAKALWRVSRTNKHTHRTNTHAKLDPGRNKSGSVWCTPQVGFLDVKHGVMCFNEQAPTITLINTIDHVINRTIPPSDWRWMDRDLIVGWEKSQAEISWGCRGPHTNFKGEAQVCVCVWGVAAWPAGKECPSAHWRPETPSGSCCLHSEAAAEGLR